MTTNLIENMNIIGDGFVKACGRGDLRAAERMSDHLQEIMVDAIATHDPELLLALWKDMEQLRDRITLAPDAQSTPPEARWLLRAHVALLHAALRRFTPVRLSESPDLQQLRPAVLTALLAADSDLSVAEIAQRTDAATSLIALVLADLQINKIVRTRKAGRVAYVRLTANGRIEAAKIVNAA